MKGLITGIKRLAIHDGEGIRSTVFFKGCPLKCIWCHNPENIRFGKEVAFYEQKCMECGSCHKVCPNEAITIVDGKPLLERAKCIHCLGICGQVCPSEAMTFYGEEWNVDSLVELLLKDKPFYDASGGGVTLSGGECLAQPEFAIELAKSLFLEGISVDIDTCGFVQREVFERILPYTDTFLYDIKAISPEVHKLCTGGDNMLILDNLKFISECGCKIEIRYPYVKGYNDMECESIGKLLSQMKGITKVKVLGYHSYADSKYKALGIQNTLPKVCVTADDVEEAVNKLKKYGLNVVNGMRND